MSCHSLAVETEKYTRHTCDRSIDGVVVCAFACCSTLVRIAVERELLLFSRHKVFIISFFVSRFSVVLLSRKKIILHFLGRECERESIKNEQRRMDKQRKTCCRALFAHLIMQTTL